MDTQRQDHSGKKRLSAGVKRPDPFWGMIVPSANLGRPKSNHATRVDTTYSRINHGEELKDTQPATRKEKARPEPTTGAQPSHPYISVAVPLTPIQSLDGDKRTGDGRPSEGKVLASNSALQKVDSDGEPSKESDDAEESEGDSEYEEDDSETASEYSGPATPKSQPSSRTSRRGITSVRGSLTELKKPSSTTAPKRKVVPSPPASTTGKRPRKISRIAVEESEGNSEGDEDKDKDEEEVLSVPHNTNRLTNTRPQRQRLSELVTAAPRSRKNQPWSEEEEETLFRLRNQGKDWQYIGECVLGRTAEGANNHWKFLMKESQKHVEMRNKRRPRRQDWPVFSAMAKIPLKNRPWSKEEDQELISLHAKGKAWTSISRRLQGRNDQACKTRWAKLKNQCPQAIGASKEAELDNKSVSSENQNAPSTTANQLDLEAEDAGFESRSATVGCDDPRSSTNNNSPMDADINTTSAKQPDRETVVVQGGFVSVDAGKRFEIKATSTGHHNQHAANFVTGGEAPSPITEGSGDWKQPDPQPVIARRESIKQKESSFQKDLLRRGLLSLLDERGTREPRTHRRSSSWS